MVWSYSWDQLLTNPVYAVRLLIGDNVQCDPQLQDEEIQFHVNRRSSIYGAAAECCRSLSAKFSRSVDVSIVNSKAFYSQLSKGYMMQANLFEQKAASTGAGAPYWGGISLADMQRIAANQDRVPPTFAIGMHENRLPISTSGIETPLSSIADTESE